MKLTHKVASRGRCACVGAVMAGLALVGAFDVQAATPAASRRADVGDTTVAIEAHPGEALQRVRLPLEVLRRSRSDAFADVRVLDARGQVLPMAWLAPPPVEPPRVDTVALPFAAWPRDQPPPTSHGATSIEWTADGSTLRIRRDTAGTTSTNVATAAAATTGTAAATTTTGTTTSTGTTLAAPTESTWLVDLGPLEKRGPRVLTLDWPTYREQGLVRMLRVEASTDAQDWREVGRASLVEWPSADGTGARHVLQRRVALGTLPQGARWLRLRADATFDITTLAAEVETGASARLSAEAFDTLRVPVTAEGFDLGVPLALRRLDVDSTEGSSLVAWRLERQVEATAAVSREHRPRRHLLGRDPHHRSWSASTEPEPWVHAAQGTSWRLERAGAWLRSDPVDIHADAARRWRDVAQPQTLTLSGHVIVSWLAPQIVFVASGHAPYRLELGRERAVPSSLPIETLATITSLAPNHRPGDEHRLPRAELGTIVHGAARDTPWLARSPLEVALWASLVVAVLGLAWMALRLTQDMSKEPKEPKDKAHAPNTRTVDPTKAAEAHTKEHPG